MPNGAISYGGYYQSAYGIACKLGFTGTEEDWIESLHARIEIEQDSTTGALRWRNRGTDDWEELTSLNAWAAALHACIDSANAEIETKKQELDSTVNTAKNDIQTATNALTAKSVEAQNTLDDTLNTQLGVINTAISTAIYNADNEIENKKNQCIGEIKQEIATDEEFVGLLDGIDDTTQQGGDNT